MEVDDLDGLLVPRLHVGPPGCDVPTAVELVAADDGLGVVGENRSTWDILEGDFVSKFRL